MVDSVKSHVLLAGILLLLSSCGTTEAPETVSQRPTAESPPATSVPDDASRPTVSPPVETHTLLISAEGIGDARLGMTIGELKQKLGTAAQFTVQSPFMVDFDAIAVQQSNQVQYYILYSANQPLTDSDVIQGLLTKNPNYKTAGGVGAETTLTQAELAYGQVTLSYNTENESREYARFERQPASNISFATGSGAAQSAGIYPPSTGNYNETNEFRQDAAIASILVVCLAEECAEP
jgi:hypothetical protein